MVMSVVKLLAQAALGVMLIAIVPSMASVHAQGHASAPGALSIEQLKDFYLGCERDAAAGALATEDVMHCSIAYEELKHRAFDGDFKRIRAWTLTHR
jgi:hypothetical protein